MKIANEKLVYARVTRREGLLSLLGGALFLAGCGGGGSDSNNQAAVGGTGATTSSDPNGSLSAGPIAGLGSVILSGVRFDDTDAKVVDEDDQPFPGGRDGLKLGMMCRVKGQGKSRKSDKTDKAEKIICMSELLGPVESIVLGTPAAPATLVVLGQTVKITPSTIFDEGLALTGDDPAKILKVNDIVEVHGFVLNNVITATRVERKVKAEVKAIKLRGVVSALAATTFKIGEFTITFDASAVGSLILKNGMVVRVKLTPDLPAVTVPPTPVTSGTAIKIREVEKEKDTEDHEDVEIKGPISEFTSIANFVVNGVTIDASGVAGVPALKVGDRVEVEGRMDKGVLKATKLKLEDDNDQFKFVLFGRVTGSRTDGKLKFTFDITTTGGSKLSQLTVDKSVNFTNSLKLADLRADHGGTLIIEGVAEHDGSGSIRATRIGLAPLAATA
jgi:hypothetical protein